VKVDEEPAVAFARDTETEPTGQWFGTPPCSAARLRGQEKKTSLRAAALSDKRPWWRGSATSMCAGRCTARCNRRSGAPSIHARDTLRRGRTSAREKLVDASQGGRQGGDCSERCSASPHIVLPSPPPRADRRGSRGLQATSSCRAGARQHGPGVETHAPRLGSERKSNSGSSSTLLHAGTSLIEAEAARSLNARARPDECGTRVSCVAAWRRVMVVRRRAWSRRRGLAISCGAERDRTCRDASAARRRGQIGKEVFGARPPVTVAGPC